RPARLRRRARRLDRGRAGARALYCAARAARAATGLGRRQAERAHDLALAAVRGGHRPADRPAARAAATAGRRAGRAAGADRRQPALRGTVRPRRRRARGERAPETLHGIIAARLDSLTQGEEALLQDAAVFGRVFWGGAFGAGAELDTQLQQLVRKEFIRRERRSVVAGEAEFSFAHALMREVAYGQIPRAQRAERHEAAAAWIEALGGDRLDDRADQAAHHYLSALELRRAAGLDTAPLEARARVALRQAAERASALGSNVLVHRLVRRPGPRGEPASRAGGRARPRQARLAFERTRPVWPRAPTGAAR